MPRPRANKALTKTQARKKEHLEICLDTENVSGHSSTGLDRYRFIHNALPELDLDEINVETTFLGKKLRAPIMISSMTGGFDLARVVNRHLAWQRKNSVSRWASVPSGWLLRSRPPPILFKCARSRRRFCYSATSVRCS
jgi:isopentenyl diphosphate isomerase/L-lactate dehydrogenase-like FMN-dependent dehydrogenase